MIYSYICSYQDGRKDHITTEHKTFKDAYEFCIERANSILREGGRNIQKFGAHKLALASQVGKGRIEIFYSNKHYSEPIQFIF